MTRRGQAVINIPTHGNFCGPGHPAVHNATNIENVIELMTIKPFDDIDAACRRHDICYTVAGYFNQTCDAWLVSEVRRMNFRYSDEHQRMFCNQLQFGMVSAGKIAFTRTPTSRTGNPLSDAFSDTVNYLAHQAGGYVAAGSVIALDALSHKASKGLGITPTRCNNDNSRGGYNADLQNLVFNDALIEILQYKNHIDKTKALQLRRELGINTQTSYTQRSGCAIEINMQQWKNHPVLSGNWK